ncbi:MAG TPA: hypothetical protein VMB03_06175 [Bryobacteraceae bacterium]|nr:hypothetical protein [Bryobacteraceae bacterium]
MKSESVVSWLLDGDPAIRWQAAAVSYSGLQTLSATQPEDRVDFGLHSGDVGRAALNAERFRDRELGVGDGNAAVRV